MGSSYSTNGRFLARQNKNKPIKGTVEFQSFNYGLFIGVQH